MHDHDEDGPTAEDAARFLIRLYDRAGRLSLDGAAKALDEAFGGRFLVPGPCGPQPTPAVFAAFARLAGTRVVYVPADQLFGPPFTFEK
jgi:hypothetical protein